MKRAYPRLLVLAFVFCVGNIGFAQNSNSGDIRGTVTDSSGAVVPGANVTVTNNDTGVVNKYVTNRRRLIRHQFDSARKLHAQVRQAGICNLRARRGFA